MRALCRCVCNPWIRKAWCDACLAGSVLLLWVPPLLLCSLCVGVLFISYMVHVRYQPYLDSNLEMARNAQIVTQNRSLKYVRGCVLAAVIEQCRMHPQ
jgi:hypothetical protein